MIPLDNNSTSIREPILAIFYIWIGYWLILGLLQFCGLPVGLNIWPLGDDRNWLSFMYNAPGLGMIHEFWQVDGRNPLSAWWWLAASHCIKKATWALHIIKICVDPILAVTIFLLLDRLSRQKCRTFCFSVALTTLMWNFNISHQMIIWVFNIAAEFTLLSILLYCQFIDSERKKSLSFAFAIVCYLIGIATYTIQSGAIIAIPFIAIYRLKGPIKKRMLYAISDTLIFAMIFIIYNCIWYTTIGTTGDDQFLHSFGFSQIVDQFIKSLNQFIFPVAYWWLYHFSREWSLSLRVFIFSVAFFIYYFIFFKSVGKKLTDSSIEFPVGWTSVILLALALPTLLLESANQIWGPGTRSPMIQQLFQPLLYVSIIFLVIKKLPSINLKQKRYLALVFVALLGAFNAIIGLHYNYRQVVTTHYQKILAKRLKQLDRGNLPAYFLIYIVNNNNPYIIPPNSPNFAPTLLHRKDVFLRTVSVDPYFGKIVFSSDDKGVINAAPIVNIQPVSYKNVWIVFFDGKKVWAPNIIYQKDIAETDVDWQRDKPIYQEKMHPEVFLSRR